MRLTWSRGSSRAYRATRREFTVSPRGGRIYLALRVVKPARVDLCPPDPCLWGADPCLGNKVSSVTRFAATAKVRRIYDLQPRGTAISSNLRRRRCVVSPHSGQMSQDIVDTQADEGVPRWVWDAMWSTRSC